MPVLVSLHIYSVLLRGWSRTELKPRSLGGGTMDFWSIIEPVGMIVGVVVAVAAVYFVITAIKGKMQEREERAGGSGRGGSHMRR